MSDARSWYFECSGPILLDRSAGASHLDTNRAPWGEIACIPHKGCRLEIVATAKTTDPLVNLLLPGHVIRYKRAFFFRDQFELPSNATVGLDELVGFKLQLAPSAAPMRPAEELILELATAR